METNDLGLVNPLGKDAPRGLASGLLRYGSIPAFRAASPLPKNTQEVIDNAVVKVGRQRLVIADDMISSGLTYSLPNWLSVPTLTSHKLAEAGHAQRSMVPAPRGERQVQQWTTYTLPVYCTWDDFSFGIRELMAAERVGSPLDTTHVEQATRNVNDAIEDAIINGAVQVDGLTTPGMLATTNTKQYVDSEAWTAANHSGEDILADVLGMIDVAIADKYYGPYNLYVPTTYGSKLNQDFKSATSGTIMERLLSVNAGGRNIVIKTADKLPTDKTLLVQMTSDVLDVIVGQSPAAISWEDGPGMTRNFVVMACIVPRIKSNSDGNFGIVKGYST